MKKNSTIPVNLIYSVFTGKIEFSSASQLLSLQLDKEVIFPFQDIGCVENGGLLLSFGIVFQWSA